MTAALGIIFVIVYAAIALEHPLKINKSASALIGAGVLWTVYTLSQGNPGEINHELGESLMGTAQILFFLMGAMTIVEVIDAHHGFNVITSRIKTSSLSTLAWVIGIVTFFLSAVLDNLTTTIVMISLIRKLVKEADNRLYFAGLIVIAANAGGAWSPIGDVTTTMLWIGGQITSLAIIKGVFLCSLVSLLVPLTIIGYTLRGKPVTPVTETRSETRYRATSFESNLMFFLGIGILVSVPAFKVVTQLPPFLGILFGLGILWLVGDLVHRDAEEYGKEHLTLVSALKRIDMSSLVFFVGILLSVAVLEHSHILTDLAKWLDQTVGRIEIIVILIGLASAVVDNVPLVAASMGMYDLAQYPTDHLIWEFMAYCAGTGGSILIIGSAAGVAAMGMEKIQFFWYVRKFSLLALIGYLAGAGVYLLQYWAQH